jgi:hypothetical protein
MNGLWAYIDERLQQPAVAKPVRFRPRPPLTIAPQALAG